MRRAVARENPVAFAASDNAGPYAFRADRTLYTRWGDWFPWLAVAISALLMLYAAVPHQITRTS